MPTQRIVTVADLGPNQWSGQVPHCLRIDEDIENVNHQDRLTAIALYLTERFRLTAATLPDDSLVTGCRLWLGYWGWYDIPPAPAVRFKLFVDAEEVGEISVCVNTSAVFMVGFVDWTFTRELTKAEIGAGLIFSMYSLDDGGYEQPKQEP